MTCDRLPNFRVVEPESTDECLVIEDLFQVGDARPSVTNGAEDVVEMLVGLGHLPPGRRLEYYDTDGNRDEIIVNEDGTFGGFRVIQKDGEVRFDV